MSDSAGCGIGERPRGLTKMSPLGRCHTLDRKIRHQ
nr:MAG TPA: hypothetical protein [Caudoviricetes sp.]DAS85860.1 MAG TPA: hypothetical protein [Caudoviricetes sp.]